MDQKYIAFISYRHVPLDAAMAKTLHRQIERYVIPRKLRKSGKRFGTVFRDKEGMAASSNLRQNLKDALDQSEYLIVVCSPDTAKTGWVCEEIEYFLQHHPRNKVFTVLAKGETKSVIPEILQYNTDPESGETVKVTPLAVDARGRTIRASCRKLRHEITKLYAGMLGCSHDDLAERAQRRFRRRLTAAFLSALLVTLSFTAVVLGKNLEIEKQNQALEQQNEELLLRESKLLTQDAQNALAAGDRYAAIESAVAALPSVEGERPYYAPAEQALIAAMGYLEDSPISFVNIHKTLQCVSQISDFCITHDGSRVVSIDNYGTVTCFNGRTGDVLWHEYYSQIQDFDDPTILCCDALNSVIVRWNSTTISAISQEKGGILWTTNIIPSMANRPLLSADQQMLVFAAEKTPYHYIDEYGSVVSVGTYTSYFMTVSTETGEVLCDVDLSEMINQHFGSDQYTCNIESWYVGDDTAATLSDDNGTYIGFLTAANADTSEEFICYYAVDLKSGTGRILYSRILDPSEPIASVFVCFADGGRKLVSIQAINADSDGYIMLEAISLESYELVWMQEIPSHWDAYNYEIGEVYHQSMGNDLMIGYQNRLYLLDSETGRCKSSVELDYDICLLATTDEKSFQLVSENGDYLTGSISDDHISYPKVEFAMETWIDNKVYNNCYPFDEIVNGASVKIATDDDGRPILSFVPREFIYSIEVYHLLSPEGLVDWNELQIPDDWWLDYSLGAGTSFENSFVLGTFSSPVWAEDTSFYVIVDTSTYQTTASKIPEDYLDDTAKVCFLPDGSGFIFGFESNLASLYDTRTGEELLPLEGHTYGSSSYITITPDQKVVAVELNQGTSTIRINNDNPTMIEHPKLMPFSEFGANQMGQNGLLVYFHLFDEPTKQPGFVVCNTETATWTEIRGEESWDFEEYTGHDVKICVGNNLPVFATLDSQNMLRIYDGISCEKLYESILSIPLDSVVTMSFIFEDAYLVFQTTEDQIIICDAMTGDIVYREQFYSYSGDSNPHFYEDTQNDRLYITIVSPDFGHYGICLNTRTWMKMAEIPGMITYDERENTIYRFLYDDGIGDCGIAACQIPGTQELVDLANAYLNQN